MGLFMHLYERVILTFVITYGLKLGCCCLLEVILKYYMLNARILDMCAWKKLWLSETPQVDRS